MGYRILNANLNPRTQCQVLRDDESPELIYMEVRDKKFAYDPNSMALLEVDSFEDYENLKRNPPSPYVMARYKPVFGCFGTWGNKVSTLVLEATHDCPLRCSYCFVSLYEHKGKDGDTMTFEMAKRAIDDLVETKQHFSTGFFGGEPMMNWKLIVKVTEYVEHLAKMHSPICRTCGGSCKIRGGEICPNCLGLGKQRPGLHITTNGVLFTPERVRFLDQHGYSLIVSIDGTQKGHDAARPYADGRGSWKKVMEGLKLLKGTRLVQSNTLRSTFAANSNEPIDVRLEFLNQLCDDGMAGWVSVEPVALSHNSPLKDKGLEIHTENAWEVFKEQYYGTCDWWIKRAKEGKIPRFHNVNKTMERFLWAAHSATECGAGRGYLSVNGKGQIFACHREGQSYIGDLAYGVDEQLRSQWVENRIYARKGCLECPVRWACGGSCREDSLSDHGDITRPSPVGCMIKQMWCEACFYIMASVPKETLANIVKDPFGNNRGCGELCSYVPINRVQYDSAGVAIPQNVNGIPVLALTRPQDSRPSGRPPLVKIG